MVQAVSTGSGSCNGTPILDECDLGDPQAYNSIQMELVTVAAKFLGERPVPFDCADPATYDQLCRAILKATCDADAAVASDVTIADDHVKICIGGENRIITFADLFSLFTGQSICDLPAATPAEIAALADKDADLQVGICIDGAQKKVTLGDLRACLVTPQAVFDAICQAWADGLITQTLPDGPWDLQFTSAPGATPCVIEGVGQGGGM